MLRSRKSMKIKILIILFIALCINAFAQNSTLSGYVKDIKNGESLLDVKIVIPELQKGAYSNEYGFYSLSVPSGEYEVEYRLSGYTTETILVNLVKDTVIDVELEVPSELQEIDGVVVTAEKKDGNITDNNIGQVGLEMDRIKTLPAFMGEVDIVKTLQLLPGIQSASEGAQGFYVRGGGPDQNLVLLDGAQVYNASHLFGFFSVFNVDAVKNVNLIKGGMPAQYGGRLASVLNVNMNEGNSKRFGVKGGLGLISSRLTLEGPLKKDKGSFILSGRRTYIDIFLKNFVPEESNFSGSSYFFYDFNAKFNYKITDKDKIYLSGYYGKDKFTFATKEDDFKVDMPWGNGIVSARWNHIFTPKLFMNVNLTFTDYLFKFVSSQDEFNFELKSGVRDYGSKVDFTYFPNPRHEIKFGTQYTYHVFTPTSVSARQDSIEFDTGDAQQLFSHETAFYVQDEFDVNEDWSVNFGLRYSMFHHVGPFKRYIKNGVGVQDSIVQYSKGELIQFYNFLEPRFSTRYILNKTSSIKAGFNYNAQYIHLASLSAVSLPTDIWFPSTDIATPQLGWQASIGYFRNFFDDNFETSVEIYYKGMNNLIEFEEGALPSDNVNDNTDNLLVFGTGRSYGIEFYINKTYGKFTGWIGYTWAKTERLFPDLQENYFPAKYDRRHDVSVVGSYKLNERWIFSASFVFATGNTMTLPTSWYLQDGDVLFNYGAKNSSRMADYHRLDLSATWYDKPTKTKIDKETRESIEVEKRFRSNWNFSIYNVYNRANPYFLFVDADGQALQEQFSISLKQVSLFPIIPSITWNFEF